MAIARELAKLQVSFPELSLEFMAVLSERVKVNGFSTERLKDAIGHVIDTFPYRRPSVSDIIGFDRKFKLFTYSEVYRLIVEKGDAEWSDFEVVKFEGEFFRIKKTDKKLFDYATKTVSD